MTALCPTFKCLSLTLLIVLADIALFIFLASVGLDKSSNRLLSIKAITVIDYGANYRSGVLKG